MKQSPMKRRHSRKVVLVACLFVPVLTMAMNGTNCGVGPTLPPITGDSGLTGKYVGAERCSQCHNNVHADWKQTLHAGALETLEAIGQDKNAACLGCHTVGYGDTGGYQSRALTNSLAGVQCENCHGPGGEHAANVNDEALRPKIDISASVCGTCHTGDHHPNFEDWQMSKHAAVNPELVTRFAAGNSLQSCGKCHSGDYFFNAVIKGESIPDNYLQGKTSEQMAGITCAICHNPHARTGNAVMPDTDRDYQLRYKQVTFPAPSNSLADAQDPTRFNICGQCHHARNNVWTDTARDPHPSDQANVFFGEMPLPVAFPEPIVPNRASVHLNAAEQCSTCHVARKPFEEGIAPAVSGHTFEINFLGCVSCHGSVDVSKAKLAALEAEMEFRLGLVEDALNAWSARSTALCSAFAHTGPCWEFTSEGGMNSAGQAKIPDGIKKARYILYYVKAGGGNGAHNPDYVREALILAEEYAATAPDGVP